MTTQEPETEQQGIEQQEAAGEIATNQATETPATPSAPGEKHALRSALLGSALYLAFFTGMTLFNLHPPKLHPILWAIITPLTTIVYLLILVYTIRLITRLSLTARLETLAMVVALFIFAAINPAVRDVIWGLLHGERLEKIFALMGSVDLPPSLQVLVPFFLIVTGVYFGQLLTRIIREPAMLVPVSIIAGLIDFWGVYWGPVGAWSEQAPAAVNMATAATAGAATPQHVYEQMPQQLQIFSSISPPQSIGIGDFVFLAFFLACAHRLGFSARRTMWGIFFGLLASTVVMALDGTRLFGHDISIQYLPGLVFICAGAMLANLRAWRLSAQEWAMTGVLVAILAAFIGVSIVRAEMGKPHDIKQAFTLTASSNEELFAQAIKRSVGNLQPAGETLVTSAGFQFVVQRKKPVLDAWEIQILVRSANALGGNHRFTLGGYRVKPGANTWQIKAIGLSKRRLEPAEWAQDQAEHAVPAKAFSLVERIASEPVAAKDKVLMLLMNEKQAALFGETRNILQKYDIKQLAEQ